MKNAITHLCLAAILAIASFVAPTAYAQTPPTAPTDVAADAVAGKTVTLAVTAQGTQPFTYQWERAAIGSTTFAPISGATGASLVIPSVAAANVGVYRVKISNVAGAITSPTATVRLAVGPSIESYTITVSGE